MTQTSAPMRTLVRHAVGGGWGHAEPGDDTAQVAIIRGADFPAVAVGDTSRVPRRWEASKKLPSRTLCPGDIILEISGGSSDRPTGRTVFVSERLLNSFECPVIPASFCRLVRVDSTQADPYYVYWWLQGMYADGRTWGYQNRSTGIANFQFEYFLDAETVTLPPIEEQRAIAATLGTLDDKIEANHRQRRLLRSLGAALFTKALICGGVQRPLKAVTTSIARGIAPKYADDDANAPLVLNQKCIRGGWVSLVPARRTQGRTVAPAKIASGGDILVNSTGVGTLGRVARWHEGSILVDSHVSVIKPDPAEVGPVTLGYALLALQPELEALGEGSTGQTELNPTRLGEFGVLLPRDTKLNGLEDVLVALERRASLVADENDRLAAVRNTLLPALVLGRVRVPVEEAV
ncbi:hypothetical protein GCM10022275_19810 [Tessaracoccus defluvii]